MALKDCIDKALKARRITPEQARKIEKMTAQSDADELRILEIFIQDAQEAKRRMQLQVIATKRNLADIKAHPKGIGRGVEALLIRDIESRAPFSNVDYRRKAILSETYSRMAELLDRYRTKNLGFSQDRAGIKRMVKELFGESTGDVDAKAFARMWGETAEAARMRFNVAGGNIPKRKDWGLPHMHKANKIAAVPFEEWRDFIVPRLDRRRIFNKFGDPMNEPQFEKLIAGLYEDFRVKAGMIGSPTPRNIPNRPDHRLLTFKDGTSWLEYNDRFGEPDTYHAMMSHLDHMAGDIALMEILGPNPDAAFRQFQEMAREAGTSTATMTMTRQAFEVVTGRINQTDSDRIASIGTGTRNLLSSAQLGSAFVSSFSDLWTTRMTAAANGIPSVRMLSRWFSQMRPGNAADRQFAVKLGLGAEAWITRALSATRFQDITGNGLSARISDTVFRATLLSPWTDSGRQAFGMEFLGFVAEQVGRKFDDLPGLMRNGFGRYGITERHWDVIRRAQLIDRKGAKFLRPADILEQSRKEVEGLARIFGTAAENVEAEIKLRGSRAGAATRRLRQGGKEAEEALARIDLIRDTSNKLQEMVLTEMDFAVPMPDARVKAIATQGTRRGTIIGEVVRSVALYKQFPITIITTHLYRGARGLDGLKRGQYLAELMVGMTIMGAIAWQTKNFLKGKDPQDMTDPKFWAQAFAQGGGAGIYGDFIQASESRFGKSLTSTLAGPVFGLLDDSTRLTMGNLHQVLAGKEANFMRETIQFAKRYTPGSNAWYARVALERLFWDRLLAASDPKAHQSFRRIMQRARKTYNQEFWWKPGQVTPSRGPDVGALVGE